MAHSDAMSCCCLRRMAGFPWERRWRVFITELKAGINAGVGIILASDETILGLDFIEDWMAGYPQAIRKLPQPFHSVMSALFLYLHNFHNHFPILNWLPQKIKLSYILTSSVRVSAQGSAMLWLNFIDPEAKQLVSHCKMEHIQRFLTVLLR